MRALFTKFSVLHHFGLKENSNAQTLPFHRDGAAYQLRQLSTATPGASENDGCL